MKETWSALKKSGIAFFNVMHRLDSKHRKDYDELVRELEQVYWSVN